MSRPETRIPEREARALWRRAAELQAEAARRLEERSGLPAPQDGAADAAEAGYRLDDVVAAAKEAGISPEHVDLALAEWRGGSANLVEGPQERPSALAASFLGNPPLAMEVSRVVGAPAEDVYAVMQRILPSPRFGLALVDHHGADPVDGGVLVFNVPRYAYSLSPTADQPFAYEMAWAGLMRLRFSLRRLPGDSAAEVTVQASLVPGQRLTTWLGLTACLVPGLVLGLAVTAATGASGLGVPAGIVGVGAAVAGLATAGWRKLYRYGMRRSEKAIRDLIGAIAVDIETGGGFSGRGHTLAGPRSDSAAESS